MYKSNLAEGLRLTLLVINVGRWLGREMYRQKADLYHFREKGDFRSASRRGIVLSTCNQIWQLEK